MIFNIYAWYIFAVAPFIFFNILVLVINIAENVILQFDEWGFPYYLSTES